MVFFDYIYWHFMVAPRNIAEIGANYVLANWHRFLISQHAGSLFAPWHRRQPSDFGKTKDIGDRILGGITDFYIRILAAFVRSSIIVLGLAVEVLTLCAFVVIFFCWVLWPVVMVSLISLGMYYIS